MGIAERVGTGPIRCLLGGPTLHSLNMSNSLRLLLLDLLCVQVEPQVCVVHLSSRHSNMVVVGAGDVVAFEADRSETGIRHGELLRACHTSRTGARTWCILRRCREL